MVWFLVGLAIIAAGILVPGSFARRSHRRAEAISEVPRYDCSQILEHAREAPGMRVSVHGRVAAAPNGTLRSPITDTECAWYRLTISERIRETTRDDGSSSSSEREKVVSEEASFEAIAITDGTGTVLVEPSSAHVDSAVKSFDRLEPPPAQAGSTISFGKLAFSLGSSDGVIGIRKREEIIPIGRDAYILGGAFERENQGAIAAPNSGDYIISLRSGDALLKATRQRTLLWVGAGVLAVVGGVIIAVVGLVSG